MSILHSIGEDVASSVVMVIPAADWRSLRLVCRQWRHVVDSVALEVLMRRVLVDKSLQLDTLSENELWAPTNDPLTGSRSVKDEKTCQRIGLNVVKEEEGSGDLWQRWLHSDRSFSHFSCMTDFPLAALEEVLATFGGCLRSVSFYFYRAGPADGSSKDDETLASRVVSLVVTYCPNIRQVFGLEGLLKESALVPLLSAFASQLESMESTWMCSQKMTSIVLEGILEVLGSKGLPKLSALSLQGASAYDSDPKHDDELDALFISTLQLLPATMTYLDLSFNTLTRDSIASIGSTSPSLLRVLRLEAAEVPGPDPRAEVDQAIFSDLFRRNPLLQQLELSEFELPFGDLEAEKLVRYCPQLEGLAREVPAWNRDSAVTPSSDGVGMLLTGLPSLRKLSGFDRQLQRCPAFIGSRVCRQLVDLVLDADVVVKAMGREHVVKMGESTGSLETLTMENATDEVLQPFLRRNAETLTTLKLTWREGGSPGGTTLNAIAACGALRHLHLRDEVFMAAPVVSLGEIVSRCPNLCGLAIGTAFGGASTFKSPLSAEVWPLLASCIPPSVRFLRIYTLAPETVPADVVMPVVARCPRLHTLACPTQIEVEATARELLRHCPLLQSCSLLPPTPEELFPPGMSITKYSYGYTSL